MFKKPGLFEILRDATTEGNAGAADDSATAAAAAAALEAEKTKPVVTPEPDINSAKLLREIMEKKAKLVELQGQIAAYGGVDPETVKTMMKSKQDGELAAAEQKGDFDRAKIMMAEQHVREMAQIQEKLDAALSSRAVDTKLIDDLTIGSSFSASAFIKNSMTLPPGKVRDLFGAHFEVKDGKITAFDKKTGIPGRTELIDASGNSMSFEAAISRLVEMDPDRIDLEKAKVVPGATSSTTSLTKKVEGPALRGRALIAHNLALADKK